MKDGNTGQEEPLTDEILTALDLCQQNNIFEFNGQLYRQTQGHGTGQKMAPPVACAGAGVIEQEFLGFPEVSSLLEEEFWWRYIDDIFGLTEGDKEEIDRALRLFNIMYPGKIILIWERSDKSITFLNVDLVLDRAPDN